MRSRGCGLYQLGEAIVVEVLEIDDRQGVIPAGTVFAVMDREGREAEDEPIVSQINLADCEFLCSMNEEGS